jgi:signal transduction histidine kinase
VPPVVKVYASKPQKPGGAVDIHVRDNGIGIAPEQHEHIFEMFSRLHSEAKIPGTGIGLATVKQIVERHHGTVRLRSRIGQGSEFIIHLPSSEPI